MRPEDVPGEWVLTDKAGQRFADTLLKPPEPNETLKAAAARYLARAAAIRALGDEG